MNHDEKQIEIAKAIDRLATLALRRHLYVDDDPWYSCPKAPGGTLRDVPDKCDCGADEHNADVVKLKQEIIALLVS